MKRIALMATCLLAAAACSTKDKTAEAPKSPDPDKVASTAGTLPPGFASQTDKPDASMANARYVASGDEWEVSTGPAHIVYDPKVMGNGNYTASASIEQLEAPAHPEAYGIFIGGTTSTKRRWPTRTFSCARRATLQSRFAKALRLVT